MAILPSNLRRSKKCVHKYIYFLCLYIYIDIFIYIYTWKYHETSQHFPNHCFQHITICSACDGASSASLITWQFPTFQIPNNGTKRCHIFHHLGYSKYQSWAIAQSIVESNGQKTWLHRPSHWYPPFNFHSPPSEIQAYGCPFDTNFETVMSASPSEKFIKRVSIRSSRFSRNYCQSIQNCSAESTGAWNPCTRDFSLKYFLRRLSWVHNLHNFVALTSA